MFYNSENTTSTPAFSLADLTLVLFLDALVLIGFWIVATLPRPIKAKLQINSEKRSRALTHLLRHGGSGGKYRKCVGPNGYASMRVVTSLLDMTEQQVIQIVKSCPKQRFEILSNTEGTFVRCVQGHSDYMNIDPELLFERLTQETVSQYLTHGTHPSKVGSILDLGLSRMSRSHIHFVEGIVDSTHYFIPGFRTGSQRTIVVDAHAAMARGIVFYRSTNGVILTSGAGGVLSSEFIVKEKSRLQIFNDTAEAIKNVDKFIVDARPILGQVSGFIEDTRPMLGQIDALLAKSNLAADSATRTLNSLEGFFHGGEKSMLNRILRVIDVIINVSLAGEGKRVWSLLYNVSTRFGMEITGEIAKLFGATRAVQQIHVELADQVMKGWSSVDASDSVNSILSTFENTIGNHREITVAGLGATVAILLQFCLGLPRNGSIDGILKFFGDRCRNMKNIVDFGKSSATMFGAIGDWIVTSCFPKLAKPHGLDEYVAGYDAWTKEILDLMDPKDPVGVRMMKDKKLVYRVDWLYKKGISYASVVKGLSIDPKLRAHYSKMFKIIEEMRKQCDFTGVFGNRPRCKPLIIHLFGESGVGKSGMTWPLASDFVAFFADKLESAQDFASEVYFRNVEQEFWDGYSGQTVTVYDDFGQRTDSSSAPNEEFMEVIRTGNLAPYPLHMAQLDEKKRAKFVSNVVMLTSNEPSYSVGSLTFPDAYRRRIDLMVKVTVKPEFAKSGYSKTSGTTVNRLDRSKCDGPCDLRPYLLELYDPETCQPKDVPERTNPPEWMNNRAMEYEEFLDMCLATANASMNDSMLFNNKLDTRMTNERFARIKAKQQIDVKWDKDLDMTEVDFTELRTAPLVELRKSFSTLLSLKSMLLLVGVILAGVGIWKMFKSTKDKKKSHHSGGRLGAIETEGITSGDARTHVVKTIAMEATTSGDSQTKKPKVISTEGNVSGDAKTNKIRTISTEATASGDSKTNQTKTVRTEACASGDPRTRKLQTIKTEGETAAELQAWKDKTAQDLISHRILNNEYKIELDGEFALNGLFVRHNVMLVPRHLWNSLTKATNMTIWNIYGSEFTVPIRELKMVHIYDRSGESKDAMLIKFPAFVNAHSDLVKHFQQMPELSVRRVDVCVPTLRKIGDKKVAMILGNAAASFETVCLDIGVNEPEIITMRQGISYDLNTIGGDCGSPVIANENTFIRKICGIHVAAAVNGTRAYGQSVTRADLERALETLKEGGESILETDFDDLPNLEIVPAGFQLNQEISCEDVLRAFDMPADTFGYAGRCSDQKTPPGQTDIRKSEIHGLVTEPITKPAYLYRTDVNLVHKNMEKCAINTPHIPKQEVDRAVNEVKAKLLTGDSRSRLNKVLTYEEAVAGSPVSEFISGLNRSSSAGYGWEKEPGKPGKTTWFGDSEYIFSEEVREVVNERIALAKLGKRAPTVWVDTLKDERRPIEKVNQLKTRVFAFGPQDFTIAFRMYFLGFIAHIMENRITNEQSVGTNPYGYDWARTAKALQKRGKKVFAGDFSTFDGTLNSCIMAQFAQVANEFYDDGPENALIREVFMLDVYNSLHLCSGKFISLTHSQPSGNPLTTVLNSFYNSVSMRIAFYRLTNEKFDDHVTMVSFGDDNVVNFSDAISEKFNQNTVTEAYASFGMTYTDETKSGGEVQPWRQIGEVAYLKRNFVRDGAFWRCPLALETILETPNWVRKSPDSRLATRENVENSVMELAQHPRSTFNEWSTRIIKAFYDKTNEYPEVKTYDTYRLEWENLILGN